MAIDKDVLDRLLEGRDPSDVFARDGLLDDLEKALSERILNAELDEHLAGEREALPMSEPPARPSNRRNGTSPETVLTGTSRVRLDVPRDRAGTFDPQLIAKYQRRFPEFDEKIVSMCARGLSTRAIRDHLEELYGIDVSPDLVSAITDAVLDEVTAWQNRPLEPCYPLVFLDAIRVKIRDEGFVRNKAIHIALGIQPDGTREVLGLWIEQTEGAKFWLRVMNELKARGVEDILMAVTDGLKGFPEAIEAVFPDAVVQSGAPPVRDWIGPVDRSRDAPHPASCIWCGTASTSSPGRIARPSSRRSARSTAPRMPKAGLKAPFAGWSFHWKAHRSGSPFEEGPWGQKYPAVAPAWRRNWERVVPFFAFPEAVRRIVYTTNAIEALNAKLRRAVRARGHFPNDEAATKLLYLVLNRAAADWKRPPKEWVEARTQFAITFGERFRAN